MGRVGASQERFVMQSLQRREPLVNVLPQHFLNVMDSPDGGGATVKFAEQYSHLLKQYKEVKQAFESTGERQEKAVQLDGVHGTRYATKDYIAYNVDVNDRTSQQAYVTFDSNNMPDRMSTVLVTYLGERSDTTRILQTTKSYRITKGDQLAVLQSVTTRLANGKAALERTEHTSGEESYSIMRDDRQWTITAAGITGPYGDPDASVQMKQVTDDIKSAANILHHPKGEVMRDIMTRHVFSKLSKPE